MPLRMVMGSEWTKPNLQPPQGGGGNDWWNRFHLACMTSIDFWHTSRRM